MSTRNRRTRRRADRLVDDVAAVLRQGLSAVGWTQDVLAARAGTSQATVCRVLRGDAASMWLDTVGDIARALGIRLRVAAEQPFRVGRPVQRDFVHARACADIGRRLAGRGWEVRHEVEIGRDAVRGWIDTLGFRPIDGALFVAEFKSEQHDAGAIGRTLAWYERAAWEAARGFGWRPRVLGSALHLLASQENDQAVAANRDLLVQACPTRATVLGAWIDSPSGRSLPRGLAMIDPLSRRRQWLRSTRADGRRTAAPYVDYAACARAMGRGRS